jgi:hypothetical protein
VDKAQQAREAQDFDMLKQIVEQQNKIEDVKRGYRTEVFTIGDKERNRVYKDAFEAAKELGADDREATKLAQDAVLKREQMVSSERIARINASNRGDRAGSTALTPNQRAEIANKAKDNVANDIKTDMKMAMAVRKNPALRDELVRKETERLMAAAEGRTMAPAPGAASPGGARPPLSSFQR